MRQKQYRFAGGQLIHDRVWQTRCAEFNQQNPALLAAQGIALEPMRTSYFLSREIVVPTVGDGMAEWREKLFASMHRNASAAADFLKLPANRVVELGSKVAI